MKQTHSSHKKKYPQVVVLVLMVAVAVAFGVFAAVVVWIFLYITRLSYEFFWYVLPATVAIPFFPVLSCTVGGLLIGVWTKYVWLPPLSLGQSLDDVSREQRFSYKGLPKTLISSFLPLVFGASVGPGAGLIGFIAGLGTWVDDKLKAAGFLWEKKDTKKDPSANYQQKNKGVGALLRSLLSKRKKVILYIIAAASGLATLYLLTYFLGGGLGLPRFELIQWEPGDLLWTVPLALIGVVGGYLYHIADCLTKSIAQVLKNSVIVRTTLCGVVLGIVGSLLPYIMFSGREQTGELMQGYMALGAGLLIVIGIVKLIISPWCINLGWRGGNLFPVIFAGISLGYGISLTIGLDPTLCITVLASSIAAAVLRKPVVTVAVLFLCFPLGDIIFMAVAAFIGAALPLPKVLQKKEDSDLV